MSKTGLVHDSMFPHIFAKCRTRPESSCFGCSQSSVPGHETSTVAIPTTPLVDDEKVNIADFRRWQRSLVMRQLAAEGIIGSSGHPWYPYNAAGAINFTYFSLWTLLSIGGAGNDELTLETTEDPRQVLHYTKTEVSPDSPMVNVSGYQFFTAVWPGDMILFGNSAATHRWLPVVRKVLSCDATAKTLTIKVDVNCSGALTPYPDDENPVTVGIYQYGANPHQWQYAMPPAWFTGERVIRTVELAQVPEDGILQIESVPVMHPGGFDPLQPTWVFEGLLDGVWEVVQQEDERLFQLPDKAYCCFKTDKPVGAVDTITLSDDLTATYSRFRLNYFKYKAGA